MNKLKLLQDWVDNYQQLTATWDVLDKVVGASYESPLHTAISGMFDNYTDILATLVGSSSDELNWFIYDNECGKKALVAKNKDWKKMKKIKNVKDLLSLIEDKE
ncbi:MAG: hypothetical protein WC390_06740 [Sulfurimonas sp.]|jgi:hypothetical protein